MTSLYRRGVCQACGHGDGQTHHPDGCHVLVGRGRCPCAAYQASPAPPRQAPEKRLQTVCRQVAALKGFRAWHMSQARASRQSAGLPDDFLTGGPRPIALEYKAGRNKQTVEQAAFQAAWEASGGVYLLVYSVDDLVAGLERA